MRRYRSIIAVVAAACIAAPLGAQGTSRSESNPDTVKIAAPTVRADSLAAPVAVASSAVAPVLSLAPTRASAVAGIQLRTVEGVAPAPFPAPGRNSRNTAMMIVGGAALIVGSLVDGDAGTLIMVGGGLLGLYGLWQYLQ